MAVIVSVVLGALLLLVVRHYFICTISPIARIPGPWHTKFAGTTVLYHSVVGSRCEYIHALHQKYGGTVRLGPNEVSCTDLDVVQTIYSLKEDFLKTDWYANFVFAKDVGLFTTSDKDFHRQRRRLLARGLTESSLTKVYHVTTERIDVAMQQMRSDSTRSGCVDVHKWFYLLATDVIGELTFGKSYRMLEKGVKSQYIKDLGDSATLGAFKAFMPVVASVLMLLPWPLNRFSKMRQNLDEYADESLKRFMSGASGNDKPEHSLFGDMFDAFDKGQVTFHDIQIEAQSNILAGTDTTANTLTYLIWNVCRDASIRSRLVEELQTLPDSYEDSHLKELNYLDCVLQETLRLWTAAPSSLPRCVPKGGLQAGRHYIPEGVTVSTQAYTLHRNGAVFPRPAVFDPSRWEHTTDEMKRSMMPFGRGPRICIGMQLAMQEMRRTAARFFLEFPDATASTKMGMTERDMVPMNHFLLYPSGHRCIVDVN
ncbi:hypothetical protein VHEMI05564 [[Torrubiella] hemipterigena]|uniref:Cytochrome P450 n=1 Tax=[Torrubiella] hemipterigena TaxID=1531966 RepID=A0A0A1T4L6_9HYPO|nr:hypothetical protein VHEMI05564 [[Torrubiella] hemipterigena]